MIERTQPGVFFFLTRPCFFFFMRRRQKLQARVACHYCKANNNSGTVEHTIRLANQFDHELSSIRMLDIFFLDIFFLNMKQFTTECSRGRQKMNGPTAVYIISNQNNGTIIVPLDLALGTKSIF